MTDQDLSLVPNEERFSLVPRNLTEAMEYAKLIAASSLVPKSYRDEKGHVNPADVLIAIQCGQEVGLKPLQSVQNIAVINGQPTVWGDAMKGLVEASGLLESCVESWDPKSQTATCIAKRKGREAFTQTFSMEDARRACLDGKQTYRQYPQRMCLMRARAWALRNQFSDVLKGLQMREEVEDYQLVGKTPEGTEILTPRSIKPGTVDEMLKEAKATASASSAKAERAEAHSIDRSKLVRALIQGAEQKIGNGKTYYLVSYELADGKTGSASTFSESMFTLAGQLKGSLGLIGLKEIESKGQKYVNLVHIEAEVGDAHEPPPAEAEAQA